MDKSTVMFLAAIIFAAPHMTPWLAALCGGISALYGWYCLFKES